MHLCLGWIWSHGNSLMPGVDLGYAHMPGVDLDENVETEYNCGRYKLLSSRMHSLAFAVCSYSFHTVYIVFVVLFENIFKTTSVIQPQTSIVCANVACEQRLLTSLST